MSAQTRIAKLERRWRELSDARARQKRLLRWTGDRGHGRRAAQLGREMHSLRESIDKLKAQPNWKLAWAARFVAKWEGLRLTTYLDAVGVPTIGWGHTGPDVHMGMTISRARAMQLLVMDLREAAAAVSRLVKVPITVRQRIALISFAFNCGIGALEESTLLRKLNAKDYQGAADEFLKWDHAGGSRLLGLTRRRRAERWLFLHSHR